MHAFLELLQVEDAQVLARYDHPAWGGGAAVTRRAHGDGSATYIGAMTSPETLRALLAHTLREAGLWDWPQEIDAVAVRRGVNSRGREVTFLLNYSGSTVTLPSPVAGCSVLAGGAEEDSAPRIEHGQSLEIGAWDLVVLES